MQGTTGITQDSCACYTNDEKNVLWRRVFLRGRDRMECMVEFVKFEQKQAMPLEVRTGGGVDGSRWELGGGS